MAFQNAATIVVAQIFELVDPNGVIVANLINGNGGGFVSGGPFTMLEMLHNDPTTTDSSLAWTQNGATGTEIVRLEGPVGVGGSEDFRPQIDLYRSNGAPQPAVGINITSGRPDGATAALGAPQIIMESSGNVIADRFDVFGPQGQILSSGGSQRGTWFGVSLHQAVVNAPVGVPIAGTILASFNIPAAPLGGTVDIDFTAMFNLVADGSTIFAFCDYDGVAQNPNTKFQTGLAATTAASSCTLHGAVQVAVAAGAAVHTIRLIANVSIINNSWTALAGSLIKATYYR